MNEEQLFEGALKLPIDRRAQLALELIASIDGKPDADVDQAWSAELERRARLARAGKTTPIPWDRVYEELAKGQPE